METFGRSGSTGLRSRVLALLVVSVAMVVGQRAVGQRVALNSAMPQFSAGLATQAVDSGALPGSTPMQIGISLAAMPERAAALQQFLSDVQTPGSASYHKWLTPQQFATQFGATAAQITAVTAWLATQGLSVTAVSAGGTRLTASGTAAQVESAFGVGIEQYQAGANAYFANTSAASLPTAIAPMVVAVQGLNNLPTADVVSGISAGGVTAKLAAPTAAAAGAAAPTGTLTAMAAAVDANTVPVLTLTTAACSDAFAQADFDAYEALFQQANAQGITVLATSGCGTNGTGSFPASLAEVTSVVAPGAPAPANFVGVDARPDWQTAPGLPAGTTRVEPDLTTPSTLAAFAQAIGAIVQQAGSRQGNINATLYLLAPEPGLYTQPDSAAAGTWETATGLGQVDVNALIKAWPRGVAGSQTALTFSGYSVTHGQNVTLTATVTDPTNAGVPTGTVAFSSTQAGTLATIGLTSGVAMVTTNQLAGGQYNFSATYSGDSTYAASTSNTGTVTVQPEPAAISASVAAGAAFGGNMTVTVTVASGSGVGTPTGTVSVVAQVSGATTASGTLAPTGGANSPASATVTLPVPQGGTFNLQVGCSGDASFSCYQSIVVPVTVATAATTTTLSLSPTTPTTGSQVTLTASVSRVGSVAPTGSVVFYDGTTSLATVQLNNGSASFAEIFTSGSHSFTAVYSGDSNYAGSTSAASTPTGGAAPTTTSLNSSVYGVTYGQPFTLTSTVQSTSGGATPPSGTITFSAATQGVLGTATLVNGTATFTSPGTLPVGTYVLSAAYSGDTNYAASTSTSSNILTISQAQGTLTATISPATVGAGQSASIAVTVTLPFPGASPTGIVSANVFGVTGGIYTATLAPSSTTSIATATISVPAPPSPGTYTIQVTCAGSANFSCGTPPNVTLVSTNTVGNTSTSLAVSSTNPAAGVSITLTATIATAVAGTPTGTVTFYDNGKAIATGPVANKQASASVSLAAGAGQVLTAAYSGDATFNASTSAGVTVNVAGVSAAITLTPSVSSALKGANITFTATVAGGVAPTGTVTFYNSYNGASALLGMATLVTNGPGSSVAQLSTGALSDGSNQVTAAYLGDANNGAATSAAVSVTINDYAVAMNPATLTVTRGTPASVALTVSPVGTFTGTVNFTCVAPAGTDTTCSIAPSTVTSGNGTVTMTIGSTAPTASLKLLWKGASGAVAAMLLWIVVPVRRRRLPTLLLVLLALAITANLGCGSGSSNPSTTNGGSPAGLTLFTIDSAGSDGVTTVTHDYQYQVTLK